MSRQRALYLVALLLTTATTAVYLAMLRPAQAEAQQLAAELSQLQTQVATLRSQLARFQNTDPPTLPSISELQGRVDRVASTVPAREGYSIRTDTPQPFPQGAQPLATQVRVVVGVTGSYRDTVSLLRELDGLPQAAIEEMSLSRVRGSPDRVRVSATVTLIFEQSGRYP